MIGSLDLLTPHISTLFSAITRTSWNIFLLKMVLIKAPRYAFLKKIKKVLVLDKMPDAYII